MVQQHPIEEDWMDFRERPARHIYEPRAYYLESSELANRFLHNCFQRKEPTRYAIKNKGTQTRSKPNKGTTPFTTERSIKFE
jgi:hypothetical protein